MKKTLIAALIAAPALFLTGCVTDTAYYPGNTTRYVYAQPNNVYYGGWNRVGYGWNNVGYGWNRVGYAGYRGGYYNRGWGNRWGGWGHRGWGGGGWSHGGWRR